MWQQWVNGVLGLWTIAIPFIGLTGNALTWTLAITGIVVAVLGFWGAAQEQSEREEHRRAGARYQHS